MILEVVLSNRQVLYEEFDFSYTGYIREHENIYPIMDDIFIPLAQGKGENVSFIPDVYMCYVKAMFEYLVGIHRDNRYTKSFRMENLVMKNKKLKVYKLQISHVTDEMEKVKRMKRDFQELYNVLFDIFCEENKKDIPPDFANLMDNLRE